MGKSLKACSTCREFAETGKSENVDDIGQHCEWKSEVDNALPPGGFENPVECEAGSCDICGGENMPRFSFVLKELLKIPYVVTWVINVEATSPVDAAKEAHEIVQRTGTTANVYDVKSPDGNVVTVDLLDC